MRFVPLMDLLCVCSPLFANRAFVALGSQFVRL